MGHDQNDQVNLGPKTENQLKTIFSLSDQPSALSEEKIKAKWKKKKSKNK